MRKLLALVALSMTFAMASGGVAREQSDAPEMDVIGFSADGRYFAFEQYAWDIVSDAAYAAVFVIDRETNTLVEDFPIGMIPETIEGEFPARVGGFDPDPALLDQGDGTPDMLGLRKAVRAEAQVRLDALGIGLGGRRIAGIPITQRAPAETATTPLTFVLAPTLPSAIPDQQHSYTIEARPDPEPKDCFNVMPPAREKTVIFDVIASQSWPEVKDVGRQATPFKWPIPAENCAQGIWISDIIAPPAGPDGTQSVVVLFLGSLWSSAVDSAEWHALFVRLPEDKTEQPAQ